MSYQLGFSLTALLSKEAFTAPSQTQQCKQVLLPSKRTA